MLEFDQVQHAYNGTQSVNQDAAKQHCFGLPLVLKSRVLVASGLMDNCYQIVRSRSPQKNAGLAICFKIMRYFRI